MKKLWWIGANLTKGGADPLFALTLSPTEPEEDGRYGGWRELSEDRAREVWHNWFGHIMTYQTNREDLPDWAKD